MDTGQTVVEAPADPAKDAIALIKGRMPGVYAEVKRKAAEIGNLAYELVRRGARGEPRCFYAHERGVEVGTPWHIEVSPGLVEIVKVFGAPLLVIWGSPLTSER